MGALATQPDASLGEVRSNRCTGGTGTIRSARALLQNACLALSSGDDLYPGKRSSVLPERGRNVPALCFNSTPHRRCFAEVQRCRPLYVRFGGARREARSSSPPLRTCDGRKINNDNYKLCEQNGRMA